MDRLIGNDELQQQHEESIQYEEAEGAATSHTNITSSNSSENTGSINNSVSNASNDNSVSNEIRTHSSSNSSSGGGGNENDGNSEEQASPNSEALPSNVVEGIVIVRGIPVEDEVREVVAVAEMRLQVLQEQIQQRHRRAPHEGKAAFIVMMGICFLSVFQSNSADPTVYAVVNEHDLTISRLEAALYFSSYLLGELLAIPIGVYVSGRVRASRCILYGIIVPNLLTNVFSWFLPLFPLLCLARFFNGANIYFIRFACFGLLENIFAPGEERIEKQKVMYYGIGAGIVLGQIYSFFMVDSAHIAAIIAFAVRWVMVVATFWCLMQFGDPMPTIGPVLRCMHHSLSMWMYLLCIPLVGSVVSIIEFVLPIYFSSVSAFPLCSYLFAFFACGALVERFRNSFRFRLAMIAGGMLGVLIASVLVCAAQRLIAVCVLVSLFAGLASSLFYRGLFIQFTMYSALNRLLEQSISALFTCFIFIHHLGGVVGPIVYAAIYEHSPYESENVSFYLIIGLFFVLAVILMGVINLRREVLAENWETLSTRKWIQFII